MSSEDTREYIRREIENFRSSSSLLYSFIENPNYGLVIISADFHIIEANSKMREWFPLVSDASFPLCYRCLFACSESMCQNCPAQESLKTGKNTKAVIEFHHPDRGFACYRIACAPLRGPDGTICAVMELALDVTEETRKEKEHREREARYRDIIESARDAIIIFNSEGEILDINCKGLELFGYTAEELKGRPYYVLLPEDKREGHRRLRQEFLSGLHELESSRPVEGICLRKDGTAIPAEHTFSFQKTDGPVFITVIVRDISERKMYEASLKAHAEDLEREVEVRTQQLVRSEERYRILLETANDAIISADTAGGIIYFNKKAEEIYGYGRDEILGKSLSEIAPHEVWEAAQAEFHAGADSSHGKMLESRGFRRDKKTFPAEYTISVFEKDDEHTLILISRDITKRKKLEQEVQEYTAKLEEKVRGRTYELTASQQTLKGKIFELSILKEISEALASAMDIESVLNIILVGATSHHGLGFNRAFLFLISDDGNSLEGKVAIGPSDTNEAQKIWGEILGKNLTLKEILLSYTNKAGKVDTHVNNIVRSIRIPLHEDTDILVRVIKDRESLNINDAFNHPLVPKSLINLMNCTSFALIPLTAENNALGVLWADNAITKNQINDHDIERLRAFAINASLAIEKSNLIRNIQGKVAELDQANKELKQNRDRLIRSEKLAAVGEMSATVAHGLRNPLVSIGGFARRLLKKEEEDTTSRKYLQIMVDEIDRLETILTELLD
ncbi:MAG: PAS domain S-box protein, partial [Pseudomonadota bacterium]